MAINPAIRSKFIEILSADRVLSGLPARRAYECDAYTLEKSQPNIIVFPNSTEEVQRVVRYCNDEELPFTTRGAGTGLSGGAMAALGGVVISTKRMTRILEVDIPNRQLKAQSGVVNRKLTEAVFAEGLHFAPDPSSQSVSTLGGNIAENSGGPHTLKYGVTAQHILELTMVDPFGEIVKVGSRVPGGPGFDLLGVVVGSEGTVGVVTEAWVQLTSNPWSVETALVAFPTVRGATQSVADLISQGAIPAALEIMDHGILSALNLAFGLNYPEGSLALLLMEFDGEPHQASAELAKGIEVCNANGAISIDVAANEAERQKLWLARKKAIGAMGRVAPSIITHDGVIPRSRLPEMLDFISEIASKRRLKIANLFHAGDGNLHPCIAFDDRDPLQVANVIEAGEEILGRCLELGGSVTGEHGIGIEKIDFMSKMFSVEDLAMQADVKEIFNSGGLCNPCKVLPDQKGCVEHMARWKGAAT